MHQLTRAWLCGQCNQRSAQRSLERRIFRSASRLKCTCVCEQLLAFEAFRDLVKLHQAGYGDEAGIAAAQEENVSLRASAMAAAQVTSGPPVFEPRPPPRSAPLRLLSTRIASDDRPDRPAP